MLKKGEELKRIASSIIVVSLFLSLFAFAFNIQPAKAADINVTFRLLTVDGYEDTKPNSAQQFIENVTCFPNWQNITWGGYNYTSYIHLLSNSTIKPSLNKFYKDKTTKTSIENEMTNFLSKTGSGESNSFTVRIFYYNGHSKKCYKTWFFQADSKYDNRVLMNDEQLKGNFTIGDLNTSNCTLIILDTCNAAGFFEKLSKQGRVILAACKSDVPSYRWDGETNAPSPGYWATFTGNERVAYNASYTGPVGIIGTIKSALKGGMPYKIDANYDGWLSGGEVFAVSNRTTIDYENSQNKTQIPQINNGVFIGGIPFVMYTKELKRWDLNQGIVRVKTKFSCNAQAVVMPPRLHDWTMFGATANHNGITEALGPATSLLWTTPLIEGIAGSTAIADEGVFVGTLGGKAYALNVANGEVVWNFTVDGPIYSSLAVSEGLVFFGTQTGKIWALYETTGLPSWNFTIPAGETIISSPCVADGLLFICSTGSSSGTLYTLNASTGEPLFTYIAESPIHSSPAVADGLVFFGTMGTPAFPYGTLYAVAEFSGTPLWSRILSGPLVSSPSVADGKVFVGTIQIMSPGTVYALDEFTGLPLWSYLTSGDVLSSPAVDSNKAMVIVGSRDGLVYALNENSGSFIWAYPTGMIGKSSPAISGNDFVYIGANDGTFYCLHESGAFEWSYTTAGEISASPVITDNHVLVGSMDGNVYCWGPEFPDHNVQVLNATAAPITAPLGEAITINYTIANAGNVAETFAVRCAYNTTSIWGPPNYTSPTVFHTEMVTLNPGETINKTYSTGFPSGNYTILVQAEVVYGEVHMSDNDYFAGNISVVLHDVAIVSVESSKTVIGQGYSTSIVVTVANEGDFAETLDAIVYAENATTTIIIATYIIENLLQGTNTTLTFIWNTEPFSKNTYVIIANATQVQYETDITDNSLSGDTVNVTIPGDVNGDFHVDISDAALIGLNWQKTVPPAPANVDTNGDGIVDISDAAIVGLNWQKHA